jgi:hypothetical protein
MLFGACVSWQSGLQRTVATSTTEAEYMATCAATREALWMKILFVDLGLPLTCVQMICDNQARIGEFCFVGIATHFEAEGVLRITTSDSCFLVCFQVRRGWRGCRMYCYSVGPVLHELLQTNSICATDMTQALQDSVLPYVLKFLI